MADPIGGSAATTLNLDTLFLYNVTFTTSFAATIFAHLLAHTSVATLRLGKILPQVAEMDDEYDGEFTKRIVSGFTMPRVEELTLYSECGIAHFHAALDAGMTTVTRLFANFQLSMRHEDENDPARKLECLTRMIRGAVKLNSLSIHKHSSRNPLSSQNPLSPPRQLFDALEACASITEIHVNRHDDDDDDGPPDFTESQVQQLRRITARNTELGQFVANPSTFPNTKLLTLMRQFNKCPTGLYVLTRRLPELFSFQKGDRLFPTMDANTTRKLPKRRKRLI